MSAEAGARALLPWILKGRFHNVVASLPGVGERRVVSVAVTPTGRPVFPGAASLLHVARSSYEWRVSGQQVEITGADVAVEGFAPDGWRFVATRAVSRALAGGRLEAEGAPSEFSVSIVADEVARMVAAPIFAGRLRERLKAYGFSFAPVAEASVKEVIIAEGGVRARLTMRTRLFAVNAGGEVFEAFGVVAGVVEAIRRGVIPAPGQAVDRVMETIGLLVDVGGRAAEAPILRLTRRQTFAYTVGEARCDSESCRRVVEEAERRAEEKGLLAEPWVPLARARLARGVWGSVLLLPGEGRLVLGVEVYPFSPPAAIVFNFPPLNLAPLAAVAADEEAYRRALELVERGVERAERMGFQAASFLDGYEPLADAGVSLGEVRDAFRRGYPEVWQVENIAGKLDRVSGLLDLLGLAGGGEPVERQLVVELKPLAKAARERGAGRGGRRAAGAVSG